MQEAKPNVLFCHWMIVHTFLQYERSLRPYDISSLQVTVAAPVTQSFIFYGWQATNQVTDVNNAPLPDPVTTSYNVPVQLNYAVSATRSAISSPSYVSGTVSIANPSTSSSATVDTATATLTAGAPTQLNCNGQSEF
jgi:hypothetical protein